MSQHLKFTALERRAVVSLAAVYGVRMLGLFMVLPVLALFAGDLEGSTPTLIGVALGIYGLTQALLQIPFGMLSDRIGRKPVLIGGLLLFVLGSLVAAYADSMLWVIIGRALQGAGAIASTLMALLSDLVREQNRSKAMMLVGISIGASFLIALVLGPLVSTAGGLSALFTGTALLAALSLLLIVFVVPTPLFTPKRQNSHGAQLALLAPVLHNTELLRLNFGSFVLHFIMTASFITVPFLLRDGLGIASENHGYVYLVVMIFALLVIGPVMMLGERRQIVKPLFIGAVVILALSLAGLGWLPVTLWLTLGSLWLYFLAFNLLEANLPSLVTRTSDSGSRGTASGVFSTCQFFGAFLGGSCGGLAMEHYGHQGVIVVCLTLALAWVLIARGMRGPQYWHSLTLNLEPGNESSDIGSRLRALEGVREVTMVQDEPIAYLQIDETLFNQNELNGLPVSVAT